LNGGSVGHSRPAVFGPQSHPFGLTYSQWATRWSQWAFGTPTPQNSLANPANCNAAQGGPVFWLPASSTPGVVASCTVPAGTALLLTPARYLAATVTGDGNAFPELIASAKAGVDSITESSVSLDGRPLPVERFRTASPFVLRLPRVNLFGVFGGPGKAAIDGYFLMLKPLSVGTHVIKAAESFSDGTSADITITVTVTRRPH
jgi:hypothetical protein